MYLHPLSIVLQKSIPSFFAIALCSLGLTALIAYAQTGSPGESPESLVKDLGSSSYQIRTAAFQKLRELQKAAVPALQKGLASDDREVFLRCQELLELAGRSKLDLELEQFAEKGFVEGLAPLAGWERFKNIAGDSYFSRSCFATMYRADAELLTLMEKNPQQALSKVIVRCNKLQQQFRRTPNGTKKQSISTHEIAIVIYVASHPALSLDPRTVSRIYSVLSHSQIRTVLTSHPIMKKLLTSMLENVPSTQQTFYVRANLASQFGLEEYVNETIQPQLEKELEAAINQSDMNALRTTVSKAHQVGLNDLIRQKAIPVVVKVAKRVIQKRTDWNQVYSLFNVVRQVGMHDALKKELKPAFLEALPVYYKQANRYTRVYQFLSVAQVLGADKDARRILDPLVHKRLAAIEKHPSVQAISSLHTEATILGMHEGIKAFLKPAAQKLVSDCWNTTEDLNKLRQVGNLVNQMQLNHTKEKVIKPALVKLTKKLLSESDDVNKVYESYQLASSMNLLPSVSAILKESLANVLVKQTKSKFNSNNNSLYRAFSLAKTLQVKEAIPFALKVAAMKRLNGNLRGQGVYLVGELGSKEHIEGLIPLLKDTSSIGVVQMNQTRLTTQVRDVALGAMIHLSGKQLRGYGFEYVLMTGRTYDTISYNCFGFSSEKNRNAAVQKWNNKK